jgi:hypothetical protein
MEIIFCLRQVAAPDYLVRIRNVFCQESLDLFCSGLIVSFAVCASWKSIPAATHSSVQLSQPRRLF